MTEQERIDLIAVYRDAASASRAAADMAREIAADKPQHAERWLADATYHDLLAARADASAAALTAATTPSPEAPAHDVIAAALAERLRGYGVDADDLGDGVIDCGAGVEEHSEVRIGIDPDDLRACVATVYYELDEDDGTHPVEDREHGEFSPADVYGIAAAVRAATGAG